MRVKETVEKIVLFYGIYEPKKNTIKRFPISHITLWIYMCREIYIYIFMNGSHPDPIFSSTFRTCIHICHINTLYPFLIIYGDLYDDSVYTENTHTLSFGVKIKCLNHKIGDNIPRYIMWIIGWVRWYFDLWFAFDYSIWNSFYVLMCIIIIYFDILLVGRSQPQPKLISNCFLLMICQWSNVKSESLL